MSLCRFSSDGFQSDVYVYESDNGIVINIAQFKLTNNFAYPTLFSKEIADEAEFIAHTTEVLKKRQEWMRTATRTKIDLLHSGDAFTIADPKGAADRLLYLRELGYHIPQSAIDGLMEGQ